jgi:plasmid stability protein
MTQITIRRLEPGVIDGLKKRAAEAGHSMEEEARRILSEAVIDDQLERQRIWLKEMDEVRRRIFGDKVFPDSTPLIRKMRSERTRRLAKLASPRRKSKT